MYTFTLYLLLATVSTTWTKIVTHDDLDVPINYKFRYGVDDPTTGDKKSHYEVRLGKEVSGVYTVKEPDGTTRVVKYTASPKKGFNAVVQTLGHPSTTRGTFGSYGVRSHGFQVAASEPVAALDESQVDFESIKLI